MLNAVYSMMSRSQGLQLGVFSQVGFLEEKVDEPDLLDFLKALKYQVLRRGYKIKELMTLSLS